MVVMDRVNSSTRIQTPTAGGTGLHAKRIQAGLNTQIIIQVEGDTPNTFYTIGAVQTLTVNERRDVSEIYEVGFDGILQLVPTKAATYELTIDRMVFDFQRLPQSLQREYRHIHAQRRPFNLVVTDYNPYLQTQSGTITPGDAPGSGPFASVVSQATAYKTTFGNCWFTSLNFSYKANEYLITESCNLKCEYIVDSSAAITTQGQVDSLERNANIDPVGGGSVMSAFDATVSPT